MSEQHPEQTPVDETTAPSDAEPAEPDEDAERAGGGESDRIVVVTPQGMGVHEHEEGRASPADLVEHPAKVMRIGSMIKQLLEEVRSAPLDDKGRARLAEIHQRSLGELKDGLAPELIEELDRLALPFTDEAPSDAELRVAQAQLVGWLEGLFHGIQTALVAQQMAAQQQLAQIRALPPGHAPGAQGGRPRGQGVPQPGSGPTEGTGQYL